MCELYKIEGDIQEEDLLIIKEFPKVLACSRKRLKQGETMTTEENRLNAQKEMWNNFIKCSWIKSELIDLNDPFKEALTVVSIDSLIDLISKKIFKEIFFEIESVIVSGVEYPFMSEYSKFFITLFYMWF